MGKHIEMNKFYGRPSIEGAVIMKVVDVDGESVSKSTLKYLKAEHWAYRDMLHREHLYAVTETDQVLDKESEDVQKEVAQLFELADSLDANYIRFVWHP
ncbi:MAG: hypothetical protein ABJH04_07885 [Cyclobacteriaceae bacterium]